MPSTLHSAWRRTVATSPGATALTDARSGRSYTFSQLDAEAVEPTSFPTGSGIEFVRQTLAAWRSGLAICPLESPRDPRPDLGDLPPGIAHIKQTSGSTGSPQLVLFTAEQLAADADNIVTTMGFTASRPNVGVISMAHSYGFSNLVLPLLLHGVPLILGGDPLPNSLARALDCLPETGGNIPAVPAMWRAWLAAGCLDRRLVHTAISAGAPLSLELERAIYDQVGIKVHNFYGSSECGGIAYDRSDAPRACPDIVGTGMDGVSVRTAEDGCLVVGGAAVASGYLSDLAPGSLSHQEFSTQDLATIDADGTIHLTGRAGDLINIAGRKVSPATIETEILSDPSVDHCIVFGIPSKDPERVHEIVAITSGGDPEALRSRLAERLPAWQRVRNWWVNPELAPNARGKLSRNEWLEKWLEHTR
ncbi:MAG: class I adenylate-forming enzyme family protein [Verrucomicrobiales bacterium]